MTEINNFREKNLGLIAARKLLGLKDKTNHLLAVLLVAGNIIGFSDQIFDNSLNENDLSISEQNTISEKHLLTLIFDLITTIFYFKYQKDKKKAEKKNELFKLLYEGEIEKNRTINSELGRLSEINASLLLQNSKKEIDINKLQQVAAKLLREIDIVQGKVSKREKEILTRFDLIVHELKTPLNAIIGFSQILGGEVEISEKKRKSYYSYIEDSGQQILSLVNDLLMIGKIREGENILEIGKINLDTLVGECINMLQVEAEKKGVNISFSGNNNFLNLTADRKRLKQVLLNILSNAIKFTQENGKVEVSYKKDDKTISLFIKDDGIGIKQQDINKLFQLFGQVGEKERKDMGTGLGLAISKEIINAHGGEIYIHSEGLGKGTTVEIRLPI